MTQQRQWVRQAAVLASGCCVVLVCALVMGSNSGSSKPDVESMYHMWLGSNGLPVSPRKQRGLLFQFCTTNFVTEAEMRYCYARLLSVGNPSGPVKFSGQPQYDSEQVVSPLFTFSAPPMEGEGEDEEESAEKEVGGGASLAVPQQPQQLAAPQAPQQLRQAPRVVRQPEIRRPQQVYHQQQKQQQLEAKPHLPPPTSIVQPEPQGGARIITPIKLTASAKVNPQSEWAAFEAVQKASKSQWLAAQQQAKQQIHAAASAKMAAAKGLLPRLNALPRMKAQGSAELAQAGPWYDKEQALAI